MVGGERLVNESAPDESDASVFCWSACLNCDSFVSDKNRMNLDEFWQIVERTAVAPTEEEQLELYRKELDELPLGDLELFIQFYGELFVALYNWDLWLVAWLARGGRCSDDSFHYFRSWVISRGRTVYETALNDPEGLAAFIHEAESASFERFAYVGPDVYRSRTDQKPQSGGGPHPKEPAGGDWLRPELKDRSNSKMLNLCVVFNELTDQDFAIIEQRFPRLWKMCREKGIIRDKNAQDAAGTPSSNLPSFEEVAATVDPELAKTDFVAYLNALGAAAQKAYKKKD